MSFLFVRGKGGFFFSIKENIIEHSREKYGSEREVVEKIIFGGYPKTVEENKNSIYSPTLLFAWDKIKTELNIEIEISKNSSEDFKLLNQISLKLYYYVVLINKIKYNSIHTSDD